MWKWSKDMQKEQNVRLVLASASPRRRELLSQIGLEFTVMPSTKEENAKTTEAGALVQELSRQKAVDIWEQLSGGQGQNPDADQEQISEETQEPNLNGKQQPELLVVGADTVVCCEGKILGKPHSREAAAEMLTALQGRSHEVYTGVTLYSQSETVTFFECTQVEFYPMTEVEISEYIDSKEPMDKAGAYGIQGLGARFVKGIRGDYNNVVGLPVGRLYQELKSRGWM
jgi:septum formation protein maf